MTHIQRTTVILTLKPLAFAVAAALGASVALAEPMQAVPLYRGADMSRYSDNYVEFGVGNNSAKSFKFGEWTGMHKDGAFGILNFNWVNRDAREDSKYWRISGSNLGLATRGLAIEGGNQGRYSVKLSVDELDRHQFDSTQFIHRNLGSNTLTLPAGFAGISAGGSNPPSNAAAISPYLQSFDIKQERSTVKLDGAWVMASRWQVEVNYRQDQRDGTRLIGSVIGNSGGNPRSAILPYPLNDKTDQVEATLRYAGDRGQFQVGYYWSGFRNSETSLTWQNPYAQLAGTAWGTGVGFPTGQGRLGLMPSNDYSQVNASGNYDITPTTRFNGTVSYGWATQDEPFLPYTINSGLTVATPLPRSSLDGKIDTTLVNLALSMRPVKSLNLRARYYFNEHNNKTPQAQYLYVGGDSLNQAATPVGAGTARVNLPIGTRENKFVLDAEYHLAAKTMLRAAYDWKKVDYLRAGFDARNSTTNNTLMAELRRVASANLTGAVKYTYDQRRGTSFDNNSPYRASYDATVVAAGFWDNLPTHRQHFLNDYNKNSVRAQGNITASDTMSLQVAVDVFNLDYKGPDCGGTYPSPVPPTLVFPATCQGLTKADGQSYTLDGQWTPMQSLMAYAFYTYTEQGTDQNGRAYTGTAKTTQGIDPTRDWVGKLTSSDSTFGLGLKFTPAKSRVDYGAQFVFNDGKYATSISGGSALGVLNPVPDVRSKMNSLQLFAKWNYSKNITWRFNYWHQRQSTSDWAYDNTVAWTSSNLLLTGQTSPNYTANVVGVSVAIHNW